MKQFNQNLLPWTYVKFSNFCFCSNRLSSKVSLGDSFVKILSIFDRSLSDSIFGTKGGFTNLFDKLCQSIESKNE